MWWTDILRCPVCGEAVETEGKSLFCKGARRHCFDFAKEGYVNLAPSAASGGGDDAGLILARTAFLSAGHYAPLAKQVCDLLEAHAPGGVVVDAGCGEGYYSCMMAARGLRVLGFDLSKNGIKHAAKAPVGRENGALFSVAGIFKLPLADASVDAVVSLFAPVAEVEFLRVLKPGGVLLLAGAGPDHLLDLKRVLYDTPYRNQLRADAPVSMKKLAETGLSFDMKLDAAALRQLFAMTPYFYRTSREGRARLESLSELAVRAEINLMLYQK